MQIIWTNQHYREHITFLETENKLSESTLVALEAIISTLAFLSVCLLWITATTEPGIIPREKDPIGEMLEEVPYAYKQLIIK